MEIVSVKFEERFVRDIEEIMKKHRYITKAEFIREAIREKIKKLEKEILLTNLNRVYGTSKRKTTNKEIHGAREKAFQELEEAD
ncbi:hypothetical protein HYV50_04720 [Candidatus Pacearchaeota archaeon]|nr:hypothetical protein [Candidatus Pacearchaeota archaeon]